MDPFNLQGKKALVTGGAMGIGRSCAVALAQAGADVAIVDTNSQAGKKTVTELESLGVKAILVTCDIADKASVQAMVSTVVNSFGRLDIAVNNAGTGSMMTHDETFEKDEWDRILSVNLTGTWLCAQAQAQQMISQKPTEGKIINIASICASISIPGSNGAYDASKAGVVHLTRTLAAQWGRYNINVNSVSPSHVMTSMFAHSSPELRARIREITPMGHMQRPFDLGGPVVFLASQASDYLTGQELVVDGGHTLSSWLQPLERVVPPRVSAEQELVELKRDLEVMKRTYNENGNPLA